MPLRVLLIAALSLAAILAIGCGSGSDSTDDQKSDDSATAAWSYEGNTDPENWGDLDSEYKLCENGRRQSPINLVNAKRGSYPRITTDYRPERVEVEDNGHAVEIAVRNPRSSITIGGRRYQLEQIHLHLPSEEAIDGRRYAGSIHLVHVSGQGQIAVVAVLIRPGAANPTFDFDVPSKPGISAEVDEKIDPDALLPDSDLAYRYQGSLTTPPCTEGVTWTVFRQPVTLSPAQLKQISEAHHGNNRPLQPRNGRQVFFGPALVD